MQYIVNDQGEQVGVVLDLATYQQLTTTQTADPELLVAMNFEELQALAESTLSLSSQTQLDHLLAQNEQQALTSDEVAALDRLLALVDQLNILKARAKYTLRHLQAASGRA